MRAERGAADRQRAQDQSRNPLARAATWASALLIVAVLALLAGEALQASAPPSFEVRLGTLREQAGGYYLPLRVSNHGGQSVEGLQIAVRLQGPDGEVAVSSLSFDWLPAHSGRRGTVVFEQNPAGYRIETSITGYTLP